MEKSRRALGLSCVPDGQEDNYVKPLPYFSLFRYSTNFEKCCIALAISLAVLSGCFPPIVNVLYGEFCNLMIDRQYPTSVPSTKTFLLEWFGGGRILQNASISDRREALREDSRAWGIGCALFTFLQFLTSMFSVYLLCFMASRQISRIKILFFKSVLCKDLAWFDTRLAGNFIGQTSENLFLVEKGIADVVSVFIFQWTVGLINVVICFITGWQLSLLLMLFVIPVFVSTFYKEKVQSKLAAKEMSSLASAGNVAEEVFTSIRTVVAFEGENKEVERFSNHLEETKRYGIQRGMASGISNGFSWTITYFCYAVTFIYGVRLIQNSVETSDYEFTPADLLIVFFGILTALTNFGFASSHIETFSVARGAAALVFHVINTKSQINPCSGDGNTGDDCSGEIEFRNVHFEYPARPTLKILRGVNLKIKAGEVVAIVGGSGAGKSTILQLVQRLYDPSKGNIFLDGQNIKSLKVSWLRQQLAVVGQEPLLFSTTILNNILYGNLSASNEDVEEAAKKANAHDFIMKLKDGYHTVVGQKGSTLSGGQKQRIAIARALIRNPKILLLDEATSALDVNSEKIVQAALDRVAKGCTTLIVTHKLSTITNVDRIIVLAGGVVSEEGTHNELVALNGIYMQLLQTQVANVKEKKRTPVEVIPTQIIYEDAAVLPPGPRNRFSSVSNIPRGGKDQSSENLEKFKFIEIIKWSKPEWMYVFFGSVASIIAGGALPAACILFGDVFGLLSLTDTQFVLKQTDIYAIALIAIGVLAGVCIFIQLYCFAIAGMRLTTRLRIKAFHCMIHQEISYFEEENNKVGALCLRLSRDPTEIQMTMGISTGILLQAFSTITLGIALSFFFNWKITLVTITTIPFVFTGVYLESLFFGRIYETKSVENASKIAVEVFGNIKAVASLGKEQFFIEKYSQAIREGKRANSRRAWLRGFSFAIGQTAPFFGYSLALWYGGTLIADEDLHFKYVIMVSELLIFGTWTLGQSIAIGPSFGQSKVAAGRLKYIFLRKPKVLDGHSDSSPDMRSGGFIKYSNVNFAYPLKPTNTVLQDFNVNIKVGESVAVMGPSGSGKSTVIQLLQRLYDPTSGNISITNVNIKEYKLSSLRKTLGLVSQEPVLFDRSIRDNIAYGDNNRNVSIHEIVEAAESANIHSFIASLPLGYNTVLGPSGTQLSGGQKQRIAIARALVRNPQILLLDEATSALDPESESIVQDALDKASEGRTTITVAHRLGAVWNADVIYIVERGKIKEFGTHDELMQLQGLYYSMYTSDQRNTPETSEM